MQISLVSFYRQERDSVNVHNTEGKYKFISLTTSISLNYYFEIIILKIMK